MVGEKEDMTTEKVIEQKENSAPNPTGNDGVQPGAETEIKSDVAAGETEVTADSFKCEHTGSVQEQAGKTEAELGIENTPAAEQEKLDQLNKAEDKSEPEQSND